MHIAQSINTLPPRSLAVSFTVTCAQYYTLVTVFVALLTLVINHTLVTPT